MIDSTTDRWTPAAVPARPRFSAARAKNLVASSSSSEGLWVTSTTAAAPPQQVGETLGLQDVDPGLLGQGDDIVPSRLRSPDKRRANQTGGSHDRDTHNLLLSPRRGVERSERDLSTVRPVDLTFR